MYVIWKSMIAVVTMALVGLITGIAHGSTYCAGAAGPDTVLCEDFSGVNPLGGFNVFNPPGGSGSGQTAMGVAINSEELRFEHLGGFGVAHTVTATSLVVKDRLLEGDVKFDFPTERRANASILWRDATQQNQITLGLQLDENRVILDTIVGGAFTRYDAPLVVGVEQFYHLSLLISAVGGLSGYVDGVLAISVPLFDAMSLPISMNAGFSGNSRDGLDLRFDNLIITAIPLPPALLLFGSALALIGFAGRRRLNIK
ncbi:hypothetical protein A9Q83_05840 [Alphaproteobacteria bacterium 46_93_T64]|nr:hypothetical protein A9Q83_05840 [Alphaproteobacteria bacterium 46_93_T64]